MARRSAQDQGTAGAISAGLSLLPQGGSGFGSMLGGGQAQPWMNPDMVGY
jgi:hypothetical protein